MINYTELKCFNCKKKFERETSRVNYGKSKYNHTFCSHKCHNEYKIKSKNVTCKQCGKKFKKTYSQINKTKNNFCSKSCSATYNNKGVKRNCGGYNTKGNKKDYFCIVCKKKLPRKQKYCSNKCQNKDKKLKIINDWKSGKTSGLQLCGKLSVNIRKYLLEEANFTCSKCGWNEINKYTKLSPLHIHHKDGDWKNTKPKNLKVLCPNCHSLTKNYGSSNRGKGRPHRMNQYYLGKRI